MCRRGTQYFDFKLKFMRILRLLASHPLPCGCLAGVYESYTGEVIALLDARDARCNARAHREGDAVALQSPPLQASGTAADLRA
jgi:hypothetical protein